MPVLTTGDRLPNGGTVIAVRPYTSPTRTNAVVFLAIAQRGLATWIGAADGHDTELGHYFQTKEVSEAVDDFKHR